MVDTRALVQVIILKELMDSDDEKPHRGKARRWVKRRNDRGYFNNIIKELRVEDCTGFKDVFRMDKNFHIVSSVFFCLALLVIVCV